MQSYYQKLIVQPSLQMHFDILPIHWQADETAAKEFKAKYGFGKAPSSMAQRKISATVS